MGKRLFAFDYDGTVMDSRRFFHHYYEILSRVSGKKLWKDETDFYRWITPNVKENLNRVGVPDMISGLVYRYMNLRHGDLIRPYDGIKDVLLKARDNNFVALFTGNTTKAVMGKLKQHDMVNHFEAIVTVESLNGNLKPHPFGLELLMKKFGVPSSETFYVGDMGADSETAFNANANFIFASYGYHPEDMMVGRIFKTIDKPADLLEVV
jgi:phosphoglycolate phosphatase